MTGSNAGPHTGKSIGAVVAGMIFVAGLSIGTDQVLHRIGVYAPDGGGFRNTFEPSLALAYRIVFALMGAWITARLAPWRPMKHVWIQAGIGQVLAILGIMPALTQPERFGPLWYPVALAITVIPTAWLGGRLYLRGRADA